MGQRVPHEVDAAALPRGAEHLGGRLLQALVAVADHELAYAPRFTGRMIVNFTRNSEEALYSWGFVLPRTGKSLHDVEPARRRMFVEAGRLRRGALGTWSRSRAVLPR